MIGPWAEMNPRLGGIGQNNGGKIDIIQSGEKFMRVRVKCIIFITDVMRLPGIYQLK